MAVSWMLGILLLSTVLQIDAELFKVFPGTLKYSDAITFCQGQGMVLPLLTSPLAQSLAVAALPSSPESEYWIGLGYFTGDFRWGDNSLMCWENWFVSASNEPNNLDIEFCVSMRGGGSVPGAWLTKSCSTKYGIICQQHQSKRDGNFNKFQDVIPTATPLSSLRVWTESACVLHCDLTDDCHMATFNEMLGLCSVYDCHGQVTSTPNRVTWFKQ